MLDVGGLCLVWKLFFVCSADVLGNSFTNIFLLSVCVVALQCTLLGHSFLAGREFLPFSSIATTHGFHRLVANSTNSFIE